LEILHGDASEPNLATGKRYSAKSANHRRYGSDHVAGTVTGDQRHAR
jgi:hypothetical protein